MHKDTQKIFLPVAIDITDKKIVIIGGGKVALHKTMIISRFTQNVTVVSPCFKEGFGELPFTLIRRPYTPGDIRDAFLIYVCTENEELNSRIKQDAKELGILASVCDNPSLCDFISPAILKKENICIAVSSNGREVYRSIRIRDRIKEWVQNNEQTLE